VPDSKAHKHLQFIRPKRTFCRAFDAIRSNQTLFSG